MTLLEADTILLLCKEIQPVPTRPGTFGLKCIAPNGKWYQANTAPSISSARIALAGAVRKWGFSDSEK